MPLFLIWLLIVIAAVMRSAKAKNARTQSRKTKATADQRPGKQAAPKMSKHQAASIPAAMKADAVPAEGDDLPEHHHSLSGGYTPLQPDSSLYAGSLNFSSEEGEDPHDHALHLAGNQQPAEAAPRQILPEFSSAAWLQSFVLQEVLNGPSKGL